MDGYRWDCMPPEVIEQSFDEALRDGVEAGLPLELIARSTGISLDEVIRRTGVDTDVS